MCVCGHVVADFLTLLTSPKTESEEHNQQDSQPLALSGKPVSKQCWAHLTMVGSLPHFWFCLKLVRLTHASTPTIDLGSKCLRSHYPTIFMLFVLPAKTSQDTELCCTAQQMAWLIVIVIITSTSYTKSAVQLNWSCQQSPAG